MISVKSKPMTEEEIKATDGPSLIEKYSKLLTAKGAVSTGDAVEAYHIREELLRRLKPAESVKTEKKTFGELNPGEEFLAVDGSRNRFVTGGGNYAALPLDGPSKNILWWPGAQYIVEKIIE